MDNGHATFTLDKDGQWTMDNGHATFSLDKDGQWTCNI